MNESVSNMKKMLVAALMLIVMMTQISAFASSYATYAVHNEKLF